MKNLIIAKKPATPRDSAKLFIYNTVTNKIIFDRFYNLNKYLPKNSFLVFNNTKVVPARVRLRKKSGGEVETLFLTNEISNYKINKINNQIRALVDRKVAIGETLYFDKNNSVTVIGQDKNIFTFQLNFSQNSFFKLLEKKGSMPIPPYIKKSSLTEKELREKYQTMIASKNGSAAAPTAGLHFTKRLLKKLERKGFQKFFITLHIGLGTFVPPTEKNFKEKKLHQEYFEVDKKTLKDLIIMRKKGKKLVAVGTTTVRTLESLGLIKNQESARISDRHLSESRFDSVMGVTDLFIFPPYEFKMVDLLITNFHLPGSSLRMLVEAFLQFKKAKKSLEELYVLAIKNRFRFYSFGDGMLIL